MFIKGKLCELHALQENDEEARSFTEAVNEGLTTKYMFTGSIPMRVVDCKEVWEKERKAGSVQFGIWVGRKRERQVGCDLRWVMDGEFIGTCGLYSHRDIYRSWEFRILIFEPTALGRGIGTEATKLTVKYAFDRLNAHRVWLGVHEGNKGAIRAYKKAGFKLEGRLKDELYTFGKYSDAIRMGMVKREA